MTCLVQYIDQEIDAATRCSSMDLGSGFMGNNRGIKFRKDDYMKTMENKSESLRTRCQDLELACALWIAANEAKE